MNVKVLDITGFKALKEGLRLPYSKNPDVVDSFDGISFDDDTLFSIKELKLLKRLIRNGDDHAKIVRFIQIYVQVEAARYWWIEFDTYRVGVEKISSSTTHTLVKEIDKLIERYKNEGIENNIYIIAQILKNKFVRDVNINMLETFIWKYYNIFHTNKVYGDTSLITKKAKINWLKANLPEGFIQKRIVMLSLQTALRIYRQRKNHPLSDWDYFIDMLRNQVKIYNYLITEIYENEKFDFDK